MGIRPDATGIESDAPEAGLGHFFGKRGLARSPASRY